jgi:hypothetical protein
LRKFGSRRLRHVRDQGRHTVQAKETMKLSAPVTRILPLFLNFHDFLPSQWI